MDEEGGRSAYKVRGEIFIIHIKTIIQDRHHNVFAGDTCIKVSMTGAVVCAFFSITLTPYTGDVHIMALLFLIDLLKRYD